MNMCLSSAPVPTAWPAAGAFLDALSNRAFDRLAGCLADDICFRALLPRGPLELATSSAVAGQFRTWFGSADEKFAVVAASIGQTGNKLHLWWRIRLWSPDNPAAGRVAEQNAFMTGHEHIETIDLLCSGCQSDPPA
jgi:hypothetical protein